MFVLLTGNIGAGKSTLLKRLEDAGFKKVIEYTTRPMREGEKDGVDYHFVSDEEYDRIEAAGELAESQHIMTTYGVWKYGAKKSDMDGNAVFTVGVYGAAQILESGVPVLSVYMYIDRETAMQRAMHRGDELKEFERRFDKDQPELELLRDRVSMVLDATQSQEVLFRMVDNRISLERAKELNSSRYEYHIGNETVLASQPMTAGEVELYLGGDSYEKSPKAYLRMREKGMPAGKVSQIAWLLLCIYGCGFCKVCRDEPCNINDDETCTKNIADYIRKCVHDEDKEENNE